MKIALTGGPGAGKTAMIELLFHEFPNKVIQVPEAASILFQGGFPRSSARLHRKSQERAIYFVQRELENLATLEARGRILLCDRGSLDGLAYWPDDEPSFFQDIRTTRVQELSRYDWIIHLETVGNAVRSNLRIETDDEARGINEKLKRAWRDHPRHLIIDESLDFMTKTKMVIDVIERALLSQVGSSLDNKSQSSHGKSRGDASPLF